MRVINKKISLEQFRSRIPTFIDSFTIDGALIKFSELNDNKDKMYYCYPKANYEMFPCDIYMTKDQVDEFFPSGTTLFKSVSGAIDSDTTSYSDVRYDTDYCDETELKYYAIPYGLLKRMYHFFMDYNTLLSDGDDCKPVISSATKYWETYVLSEASKEYYEELDRQFAEYGGKVIVSDNKVIIGNMDDLLVNKIFTSLAIPNDYKDYWKTDKLYLISALQWYYWFDSRYAEYSGLTKIDECNEDLKCGEESSIDCCDCVEYFKRGGNEMYELLKAFVANLEDIKTSEASTSIDLPLYIQNSIDDMGEFSIFSENWEGGVEYASDVCRGNIYSGKCESYDITGGTTVIYDNNTWLKKCSSGDSYAFDPICKRFVFNGDGWIRYIDAHQNDKEVAKDVSYEEYAYNPNNELFLFEHVGDGYTSEAAQKIALKYDLITSEYGFVYLQREVRKVEKIKYIEDPKNPQKILMIQSEGRKVFVMYNGKKHFGYKNNGTWEFNLTKIPLINPIGNPQEVKEGLFVKYSKMYLKVVDGKYVTLFGYNYPVVDSYFKVNGINYFVMNETIKNPYGTFVGIRGGSSLSAVTDNNDFGEKVDIETATNTTSGYSFLGNTVLIFEPYEVYRFGLVSGQTSSKLSLLRTTTKYCDDIGTELEGVYELTETTKNAQPLENTVLDLYYKVGRVARISEIPNVDGTEPIAFWGDFLQDISFYIVNTKGEVVTREVSARDTNGSNLRAIDRVIDMYNAVAENKGKTYYLKARFTYYVGAILTKDVNGDFMLFSDANHCSKSLDGVKYIDICTLYKRPTIFHRNGNMEYNVYFYEIIPKIEKVKYRLNEVEVPMSTFEVDINTTTTPEYISGDNYISFSRYNGLDYSPVFREEYKFGSSSLEKVEENIYIERQIIKPMEKNLRLIDVMTMEDLIEYGNGTIKIINN